LALFSNFKPIKKGGVMQLSGKKSCVLFVSLVIELIANISCGKSPTSTNEIETGGIEVQVQVLEGDDGLPKVSRTAFDSLVVEITGSDISPIRYSNFINPGHSLFIDTLPAIPAGSERRIKMFTINQSGETVHEDSGGERILRVEPGVVAVLQAVLVPKRGSIYLQIGSVPTTIDSMGAVFTGSNGGRWAVAVVRAPRVFLSIDNIPNGTSGVLSVAGYTAASDTLYRARSTLTINSRTLNTVKLSFDAVPGGLSLSGSLQLPGATLVSANMGTGVVAERETGALVITEIMYAANDSEYVEVFNPSASPVAYDTLVLEIDGTRRLFTGVSVAANGYFVFGRQQLPWADTYSTVRSALDLSSNGNWITLITKDGTVLDQVAFCGGINQLEWPRISGKASICLQPGAYNAADNNFGRFWTAATTPIAGAPALLGTPHLI
jgi:hypothetical protein